MPKPRKLKIGVAAASVMLAVQLAGAGSAAADTWSDVQAYQTCSDMGIGISVSSGGATTYLQSEIAYHGNDCGGGVIAIYTTLWACTGATCFGVGNPDYSRDLGSYDFFDSQWTGTGYTGYYSYKFCVTLRNGDNERYNNLCTGLVNV